MPNLLIGERFFTVIHINSEMIFKKKVIYIVSYLSLKWCIKLVREAWQTYNTHIVQIPYGPMIYYSYSRSLSLLEKHNRNWTVYNTCFT